MTSREEFEKETGVYIFNDNKEFEHWKAYALWLEKRNEWVSVEERLPKKFMRVLVTDGKEVTQAYIDGIKDEFQGQFLLNEEWLDRPTHWRPLPTPPDEAKRGRG